MKVQFEIEVEVADLMSGVFDNLWRSSSPWIAETNWDWQASPTQTAVEVCYDTPEDGEGDFTGRSTVTAEDLAHAYGKILKEKRYHCGELVTSDIEDWDSCVADYVLQYALFEKLIYG